jgi:general secretion pathway protein H
VPRLNRTAAAPSRGFSLIEILVVVVIIGLMAAVMTVAVGALGGDSEIGDEITRLGDVVAVSLEQAELEGRDYGLRLDPEGYEVMVFDGRRGWIEAGGDRWFERHDLPAGLSVSLEAEGRRVLLRRTDTPETRLPQVVTFASGDVTPYRITLSRPASGASASIDGAVDGTMEISRDGTG